MRGLTCQLYVPFNHGAMIRSIFLTFIFFSVLCTNAQSTDALFSIWEDQSEPDSVRVKAYKDYIWNNYLFSNPDSTIVLMDELFQFAKEHNYPIAENQANTIIGIAYNIMGENEKGIEFTQKSLIANQEIGNKSGISECEIVLGVIQEELGNYPRALVHYKTALVIDEEIRNKEGIAMSLNNIGGIYMEQENLDSAIVYYEKALAIDKELGVQQGIAVGLINLGIISKIREDYDEAVRCYTEALEICEQIGDLDTKANALYSLALLYVKKGKNDLALQHFQGALSTYEILGSQRGIANINVYLGDYYLKLSQEWRALDYCKQGLELALDLGSTELESNACKCLYKAHKRLNNTSEALKFHEQFMEAKELIYSRENSKKLAQIQMRYAFDQKEAIARAEQEKKDAIALQKLQRQKLMRNGFMGGFAIVLLFAGVFLKQRIRIGKEKERSEELLLNILPAETAEELKEKGHSDARHIEKVTVLFTDFKGFTAMSEQLTPEELVKDLNACFSLFDRVCDKYGIEKIKTIGDAYMAAGGLPTPNATHAKDVVNAALEMAEIVERGKAKKVEQGLPFFEIRLGVHTGPVVAGIVGIKKFQYDIWGDTVNTASRMESSGEVGKVNISQSAYELLKNDATLTFESRGKIQAKGKGAIEMYFVSHA